jgi:hypothetical protein
VSSTKGARVRGAALVGAVNFVWIGFVMFVILGGVMLIVTLANATPYPWTTLRQMLLLLASYGAFAGFMEEMWPGTVRKR